jgi:hypothetical protein
MATSSYFPNFDESYIARYTIFPFRCISFTMLSHTEDTLTPPVKFSLTYSFLSSSAASI